MNDMTEETGTDDDAATPELLAELAISQYTAWLNCWLEENGDECDGEDLRVTRADYDECNDSPRILNDWADEGQTYRTMTIYCSPYHDEGGPTLLTAFYSNYSITRAAWQLDAVTQLFDTMHQFIFNNGSLANTPSRG